MTQIHPVVTLIHGSDFYEVYASGEIKAQSGQLRFGLINNVLPLLDAIACLCHQSTEQAQPEDCSHIQSPLDRDLAQRILGLVLFTIRHMPVK